MVAYFYACTSSLTARVIFIDSFILTSGKEVSPEPHECSSIEYKTTRYRTEFHKHFHLHGFVDPATGLGQLDCSPPPDVSPTTYFIWSSKANPSSRVRGGWPNTKTAFCDSESLCRVRPPTLPLLLNYCCVGVIGTGPADPR
eukprot:1192434-Prorocentrum_minimum.AAC.1